MKLKTAFAVKQELAKVYFFARAARSLEQLEALRIMKDALRGQLQAATIVLCACKMEMRPLPPKWSRFLYGKD